MHSLSAPNSSAPAYAQFVPPAPRWHTGNLLAFSHLDGPTDYEHGLVARTEANGLAIRLPAAAQVEFQLLSPLTECRLTSDWFEGSNGNGEKVRGVVIDAHHLLLEGPCRFEGASSAIASVSRPGRLLVGEASHFEAAWIDRDFEAEARRRLHWLGERFRQETAVPDRSRFTYFRALSQMKEQVCSPEGFLRHPWTTPDRWPHRQAWLWDSAFHAIGWRHLDPSLAQQMLEAVLDAQAPDGFVPHRIGPHNHSKVTQPPILALATQLVFEKSADQKWLAAMYPKLCAYVDWNQKHRDSDGEGLLEWYIDESPTCRSGESGMDNSSRFDAALLLDAPDFNAYQASEYEILGQFAGRLGKNEESRQWQERHAALCQLINGRLWSEDRGLYCDRDPKTGRLTDILSCAGFLPILCGAPDRTRAARLAEHLENPLTFGTAFPIPSIAEPENVRGTEQSPYAKDMWRGPTWININWLVARGLRRYGLHAAAERLREITLSELERTCEHSGTFFEYFDDRREAEPADLLRKGRNVPGHPLHQAIHDYGWSATLYVDWLLEGSAGKAA